MESQYFFSFPEHPCPLWCMGSAQLSSHWNRTHKNDSPLVSWSQVSSVWLQYYLGLCGEEENDICLPSSRNLCPVRGSCIVSRMQGNAWEPACSMVTNCASAVCLSPKLSWRPILCSVPRAKIFCVRVLSCNSTVQNVVMFFSPESFFKIGVKDYLLLWSISSFCFQWSREQAFTCARHWAWFFTDVASFTHTILWREIFPSPFSRFREVKWGDQSLTAGSLWTQDFNECFPVNSKTRSLHSSL